MPCWNNLPWRRDSNQMASDEPGAVHFVTVEGPHPRRAMDFEASVVVAVVPGVSNFIQTRVGHSAKSFREGAPRSAKKEYSHEGRINHRSTIRCSDLRDGSGFPAGNTTRCCGKYRYCASHHLWARATSKPSNGSSRVPPNSACCSSRHYHRLSVS